MLQFPWTDQFISVNGIRTRFVQAGAGPDIILVHGLGGSCEQWCKNIDYLARSHRVVCFDLPGHGKSGKPRDTAYSLEWLSRFLGDFAAGMGCGKFSLMGLSLGGGACLRYTLDNPATVDRIVLTAAAALGPRLGLPLRLAASIPFAARVNFAPPRSLYAIYVRSIVHAPENDVRDFLDFYYSAVRNPEIRATFFRALRTNCNLMGLKKAVRDDITGRLDRLSPPALIVWGRQDSFMPVSNAREALKKIPHARLVLIDDCGHNPQFEKYREFNGIVGEFLGGK
ncbi:MAG TPA: alpha/beta fold hydrolase [Chitinivibrionales bacterium]|nr:alpha/beta fold hydrolase [Chitinivibrionales bacterium]